MDYYMDCLGDLKTLKIVVTKRKHIKKLLKLKGASEYGGSNMFIISQNEKYSVNNILSFKENISLRVCIENNHITFTAYLGEMYMYGEDISQHIICKVYFILKYVIENNIELKAFRKYRDF